MRGPRTVLSMLLIVAWVPACSSADDGVSVDDGTGAEHRSGWHDRNIRRNPEGTAARAIPRARVAPGERRPRAAPAARPPAPAPAAPPARAAAKVRAGQPAPAARADGRIRSRAARRRKPERASDRMPRERNRRVGEHHAVVPSDATLLRLRHGSSEPLDALSRDGPGWHLQIHRLRRLLDQVEYR